MALSSRTRTSPTCFPGAGSRRWLPGAGHHHAIRRRTLGAAGRRRGAGADRLQVRAIGDAHHWLDGPEYAALRLRLENAHAAAEAALIEARRKMITYTRPMESGLSSTQRYLVPLITDEGGKITGVHLYHRPNLGKVLWLFTSHERGYEFMSALMSESGQRNKAFMEILEQGWDRLGSEDVNFGGHFSAKTVQEMASDLERWKVDRLIVDPGFPGWQQRIYESPYKSLAEYIDSAMSKASFEELEDGTLYA